MYINKAIIAGQYVLVSNYTHRIFVAPHRRRQKIKETTKAMHEYNKKMRTEKLQLLILLNFEGGYHITLDYPRGQRPETYEEAERILKRFLYATSRKLKKSQKPFKYIAITERGKKRAALHHHMIIEGDPFILQEITKLWGNHIKISQMYEDGAYKDLAAYFTKIETKEEQTKGKSKYHRSRNLEKPTEKSRIVAGKIPEDPMIPRGYELVSGSVVSGFNEYIGIKFQKYLLRLKPKTHLFGFNPKGEQKGSSGLHIWESVKKYLKGEGSEDRSLCSRKDKKPSRTEKGVGEVDDRMRDGLRKDRKKRWSGLFRRRNT